MLSNAYHSNYGAAVLVAGDGDYVPLVEKVERLGKIVNLVFFANSELNENLKPACDSFYDLTKHFVDATANERANWQFIGKGQGIHWDDLDEDISVESLLAGRHSGESQTSFKRWLEGREKKT